MLNTHSEKSCDGAEYKATWVSYDVGYEITGRGIEPFYLPNRQTMESVLKALCAAYDQGAEDYY